MSIVGSVELPELEDASVIHPRTSVRTLDAEAFAPTQTNGACVMDIQWDRQGATDPPVRPACLVPDCPCKDPRASSRPVAFAFFAAWAKEHGETADRVVRPDPAWPLILDRSGTV